jgi:hypothetical protein
MNSISSHAITFVAAAYVAAGLIIVDVTACFPEMRKVEAAAGYEAQHVACVDRYNDRKTIDLCRARVRAAWLIDAATDAGSEGGDQ